MQVCIKDNFLLLQKYNLSKPMGQSFHRLVEIIMTEVIMKSLRLKFYARAERLKKDLPAVFLALKKQETPFPVKLLAIITLCCALSPIDLIPDFIPVLGYLDDLLLLPVLIALTIRLIPTKVMEECRQESQTVWATGKPRRWFFALPYVFLWILFLFGVWRIVT